MPGPPATPRLLLRRGQVLTPHTEGATALAIEDGQVLWVGHESEADTLVDGATEVVDLDGALVTPGFVDAHVHLAQSGLSLEGVDLSGATDRYDALDQLAVAARAATSQVLYAYGWDDTVWPDGAFDRHEVDRATGGKIAYVCRVDAHGAVVSTSLLDAAPAIAEAEGFRPDGWVERDAHHLVRASFDRILGTGHRARFLSAALEAAARSGLVSVHELGAPHLSRPEDFAELETIAAERPVPHVVGYWGEAGAYDLAREHGLAGLAGDLCCDGAIGSRTAALTEAYHDAPESRGHLYLTREEIRDHVVGCTRQQLQAGFHVIGDRAVEAVLGGLEDAAEIVTPAAVHRARHRLEHVELLSEEAVARLGQLGVLASVQPAFDAAWGGDGALYDQRLGAERAARMNPLAELVSAGVPLALGSDSPVTPFAPWHGVGAAVNHHRDEQRIDPATAVEAHTTGGWFAAGIDDAGMLVPGARGSCAVWQVADGGSLADLLAGALAGEAVCLRTIDAGRVLHRAE